ncbi:hypothetical protein [Streptococcus fryi]
MKQVNNLNLRNAIVSMVAIVLLWLFAPSLINDIFSIGKEFGKALAQWF